MKKSEDRNIGFTLIELLIVIAIISILVGATVFYIKPLELTKRTRDNNRLTDVSSLVQAINVAMTEATQSSQTASVLCNGGAAPCSGRSDTGTRKADGTGWVKVNLAGQKVVPMPVLPSDPSNDTTYYYTYQTNATGDAYEVDTVLESDEQKGKMSNDGGNNDNVYEVGTDLTIIN